MDEEQQSIETNESEDNQGNNGQNINPPKGKSRLAKGVKDIGKEAGKKIGKAFKEGIKSLWAAIPPVAKLWIIGIAAFIVICAAVIIVLTQEASSQANDSINAGFSKDTTTAGATRYKETGSLLLATENEIKQISKEYYTNTALKGSALYEDMVKEKSGGDKDNSGVDLKFGAIKAADKLPMYDHILNTEKYNFNRIVWREWNRSELKKDLSGNPKQPKMQVDDNTKLQYPKDDANTPLETFADMVRPYLQTWVIPYALYSGTLTSSAIESNTQNVNFAYQIISSAYHKITVDKYNMKKLTKTTVQDIYDEKVTKYTTTVKCDANGNCEEISTTEEVISDDKCKQDKARETKNIDNIVQYYLKQMKTFDAYINYDYKYTEYDESKTADEMSVSRVKYKNESGSKEPAIPSSLSEGEHKFSSTYTVKEGYTETTVQIFKDKIEQTNFEKREYKVEDVEDYLGETKLDDTEKTYYKTYETSKELNVIDIMNSKKENYKMYLDSGEEYSANIGYHRSYLLYSYDALKKQLNEVQSEHSNKSFSYGKSLGLSELAVSATGGQIVDNASMEGGVDYSTLPAGGFGWPVPQSHSISQFWPRYKSGGKHTGIDIRSAGNATPLFGRGQPIVAAQAGTVKVYATGVTGYASGSYGNWVDIDHGNGYITRYGHMYPNSIVVKTGQVVKAGEKIGDMGGTGSCDPHGWVHLHFEVRRGTLANSKDIDPMAFFTQDSSGKYVSKTSAGGEASPLKVLDTSSIVNIAETEKLALKEEKNCKDFEPINWTTIGGDTVSPESITSGPPTPGNSTGVLAAMQTFYKNGGLQGKTDYGGLTWDRVSFYSSNADYCLTHHKEMIYKIAAEYGVDPLYVMAKMCIESGGGRSTGYGDGTAAGPMQIQKKVHLNNSVSAYNVKTNKTDTIVMTREALSDTETNIRVGIMMYANLLKQTNGNPFIAAQRYNMGNISYITTYANKVGKSKEEVINNYTDVGWLYEVMVYHNYQCEKTKGRWGDGYYAYKFAMYLDYLQQKAK